MQYLVILKRFEIWLLLVIVAGLIWFAFSPESGTALEEAPEPVAVLIDEMGKSEEGIPEEAEKGLRVDSVNVTDSNGGRIVELTLLGRSETEEEIVLDETRLVASTTAGDRIPHFFEPFQEKAVLPPGEEDALVTVKYWLESQADTIWLDFEGKRLQAELP
ncbi:MAG: hypothetical protein CMO55_22385 [Verrucomicrobiales bacterium]|nr:hypothetical protein [Verrucomicrobiales bacterium]